MTNLDVLHSLTGTEGVMSEPEEIAEAAVDEIRRLRYALWCITDVVSAMLSNHNSSNMFDEDLAKQCADDPQYLKSIARAELARQGPFISDQKYLSHWKYSGRNRTYEGAWMEDAKGYEHSDLHEINWGKP